MPSISLNLNTIVQTLVGMGFGFVLHRLWKKIDRIEPLATEVALLTKALKDAEGSMKGALKKISILQDVIQKHSNQVARLQNDVDWIKETR